MHESRYCQIKETPRHGIGDPADEQGGEGQNEVDGERREERV